MQFSDKKFLRIGESHVLRLLHETGQAALKLKNFSTTGFATVSVQGVGRSIVFGKKVLVQISTSESPQGLGVRIPGR